MKIHTTPNPTLEQFVEQMRLLCIQNKHTVKIKYNSEQAIASFYVKGSLVDTRTLFRL
tara:strand:- start:1737 stop:1910 length:174 start_codon:yes stop_codon:yes gene_type:complete